MRASICDVLKMQRSCQLLSSTGVLFAGDVMIIESELRHEMMRAVRNESSLNDLYRWLMSRSWNMHRDSAPDAAELASEIEALFVERSEGVLSDNELLRQLIALGDVLVPIPADIGQQLIAFRPNFVSSAIVFHPRLAWASV
jgi:hypothetical protein